MNIYKLKKQDTEIFQSEISTRKVKNRYKNTLQVQLLTGYFIFMIPIRKQVVCTPTEALLSSTLRTNK